MPAHVKTSIKILHHTSTLFWLTLGAFLAAVAVKIFLAPNSLIDGGVVGIAMISSILFGKNALPVVYILLNLPFLYLAYRFIGKTFLIQMGLAALLFAISCVLLDDAPAFHGESLEIIVVGGLVLGAGIGIVIRRGASLDGTEILAILINRKTGFTVGQIILFINIFIFAAAGFIYRDWHVALQSLMIYVVASKIMDTVIVGLDEMKSVIIICSHPDKMARLLINELGVGLTVLYGRGGFTGKDREVLYVIAERLQLAELKEIVQTEDSGAFMAIENLHEVVNGRVRKKLRKKRKAVANA